MYPAMLSILLLACTLSIDAGPNIIDLAEDPSKLDLKKPLSDQINMSTTNFNEMVGTTDPIPLWRILQYKIGIPAYIIPPSLLQNNDECQNLFAVNPRTTKPIIFSLSPEGSIINMLGVSDNEYKKIDEIKITCKKIWKQIILNQKTQEIFVISATDILYNNLGELKEGSPFKYLNYRQQLPSHTILYCSIYNEKNRLFIYSQQDNSYFISIWHQENNLFYYHSIIPLTHKLPHKETLICNQQTGNIIIPHEKSVIIFENYQPKRKKESCYKIKQTLIWNQNTINNLFCDSQNGDLIIEDNRGRVSLWTSTNNIYSLRQEIISTNQTNISNCMIYSSKTNRLFLSYPSTLETWNISDTKEPFRHFTAPMPYSINMMMINNTPLVSSRELGIHLYFKETEKIFNMGNSKSESIQDYIFLQALLLQSSPHHSITLHESYSSRLGNIIGLLDHTLLKNLNFAY